LHPAPFGSPISRFQGGEETGAGGGGGQPRSRDHRWGLHTKSPGALARRGGGGGRVPAVSPVGPGARRPAERGGGKKKTGVCGEQMDRGAGAQPGGRPNPRTRRSGAKRKPSLGKRTNKTKANTGRPFGISSQQKTQRGGVLPSHGGFFRRPGKVPSGRPAVLGPKRWPIRGVFGGLERRGGGTGPPPPPPPKRGVCGKNRPIKGGGGGGARLAVALQGAPAGNKNGGGVGAPPSNKSGPATNGWAFQVGFAGAFFWGL